MLKIMAKNISYILPDKVYLKLYYKYHLGLSLDLNNPKRYNEKLQWLKLYDRNPEYSNLVDKYEVRKYVEKTIGSQYLIPLIGIYERVEDIDFHALPNEFIIKPTHSSGKTILCRNKSELDIGDVKKILSKWLRSSLYRKTREWPYKNVKPRIIIERLIHTDNALPPKDYKFFCFHGEPKLLFVASDRGTDTKFDYFDLKWRRLDLKQHYPNSNYELEKPDQFETMIELSKILSKGLPHVRVDFYIDANQKVLFGELTFFHFSGLVNFEPESYDYLLGSWLDLSLVEKNQKEDANVWKEK